MSTPRILNARDEQHAMAHPRALASTAARGPSVSASSFAAKLRSHLHLRKTCILPLKEPSCTRLQGSRHQSAGVYTVALAIDSEQSATTVTLCTCTETGGYCSSAFMAEAEKNMGSPSTPTGRLRT